MTEPRGDWVDPMAGLGSHVAAHPPMLVRGIDTPRSIVVGLGRTVHHKTTLRHYSGLSPHCDTVAPIDTPRPHRRYLAPIAIPTDGTSLARLLWCRRLSSNTTNRLVHVWSHVYTSLTLVVTCLHIPYTGGHMFSYKRLNTCVHTCFHTCLHTFLHTCFKDAETHIYIHANTYVYTHMFTHAYAHVWTLFFHTLLYTCFHTCLHTCLVHSLHRYSQAYAYAPYKGLQFYNAIGYSP